jgi:hypothetical protein
MRKAMNKGWISLHRKIQDCWLWDDRPYDRARAWIDLLLLANHKDKKTCFYGRSLTFKKGQYLTSILKLSDRWGWSRNKTKRFLAALEDEQMITTERTNRQTAITIVNYGVYQEFKSIGEPTEGQQKNSEKTAERQQKDIGRTTDEPQTINNNNDNNDNNDNKYYKDGRLNDAFVGFVAMRRKIGKPLTDRAITMAKNKLEKLSNGDTQEAIMILNQSVFHSWQGLFEVKDDFRQWQPENTAQKDDTRGNKKKWQG